MGKRIGIIELIFGIFLLTTMVTIIIIGDSLPGYLNTPNNNDLLALQDMVLLSVLFLAVLITFCFGILFIFRGISEIKER